MSSVQSPNKLLLFILTAFFSVGICRATDVNIVPGQNIPAIVAGHPAGTTFIIHPGTYRLTATIKPKNGDKFIGQTACAPPNRACPAILLGSKVIGSSAVFDGVDYRVTNQMQQGPVATVLASEVLCDTGWAGCIYPEDLYFDGVPYKHLKSASRPAIGAREWWFDYASNTIYFHDNPSGHKVETSVLTNAFGGPGNNVTIQYLTLKQFASMYPYGTIGDAQGSPLNQQVNWTIKNCEISFNHSYGVRIGYKMQILNNYIHDNGQNGVGGGLGSIGEKSLEQVNAGILIQGNIINHNDYAHFNPDFGAGGIKIGATTGVTIRRNTIQYNEGAGIHFDDGSQQELVDGNLITDTQDSDGLANEIDYGTSLFKNNIILRNGHHVMHNYFTGQMVAHASSSVTAYCNVLEVPAGPAMSGFLISAANRGYSMYPNYQYLVTVNTSFHHNTVIWDAGATGISGYFQTDGAHQPEFFSKNARPDHNTYHMPAGKNLLLYDNNNSQMNTPKSFASYQASGADIHGSADHNYGSGYPTVSITSPADQSSFTNSVRVDATASDKSGIERVEFYVDWALKSTDTVAPYSFDVSNVSTGWHTVAAMAYSKAGIRNCYAVSLNKQ
jgi:hypothetical protein